MIDTILGFLKSITKSKLFAIIITYILLFSILVGRMFYLQIIKGASYDNEASLQKQKTKNVKSPRGKIYDCNGKLLASNEQKFAITLEDSGELDDNYSKNTMILKCINLIEKNGDKIDLDFPIAKNKKGKFYFTVGRSAQLRFKRDIYYLNSVEKLNSQQQAMNATECFQYIRTSTKENQIKIFDSEKEKDLSDEDALKIMTVRYALMMNTYSKYEPITLSSNVSEKTVAAIEENSADLPGVEVSVELNRKYYNSKYFSHIIGYTGTISQETLEEIKINDPNTEYTATDQIGKTGIEKEYEDQLKGKKGQESMVIDNSSRIVSTKQTKKTTPGNDIYLSIDSNLQKAIYTLAEKEIASILLSKLTNKKSHGTRGKKASGILVSIYDVYDAILQNSIVDVTKFSKSNASEREKYIYEQFSNEKKAVLSKIRSSLTYDDKKPLNTHTKTMQTYFEYIFQMLKTNGILNSDNLDTADSIYTKYKNGKISFSEFLINSIQKNWINLAILDIGEDYYSSDEVFGKIVEYILDILYDDNAFDKKIYHYMVQKKKITGRQICLLLYDQKILKMNKTKYAQLRTGMISPYDFIRSKIKNLQISPGELGLTPCACSVVVTSVKTGKVKALVSYPSYDNNKMANAVNADYYNKISTSSASALLNRATQQKTAPGSTFKMVTATTVLEEGIINQNTRVRDNVVFSKINKPWPRCWSTYSHGNINVSQAIQHSCNYFFYEMGYRLGNGNKNVVDNEKGLNTLKKYAAMYGLTKKSGVELPEAEPSFSDEDIVRSTIGQGTNSYTPVQLSRYVTTIANGGTCFDLTLMDKIVNTSTKEEKTNQKNNNTKIELKNTTLNAIKVGMKSVVNNLSSSINSLFKNVPVTVAGKTGTAQITAYEPNHALFVSFAPYDNPEITVTVQIPNGFTSSNAAELASKVYKYYFDKKSRKKLLNQKVSAPALGTTTQTD